MTVPLAGVPLAEHAGVYAALADAGFTDVWSSEVAGTDAFTPLALAARLAAGAAARHRDRAGLHPRARACWR